MHSNKPFPGKIHKARPSQIQHIYYGIIRNIGNNRIGTGMLAHKGGTVGRYAKEWTTRHNYTMGNNQNGTGFLIRGPDTILYKE